MPSQVADPFALSVAELESLLDTNAPLLPELEAYRHAPEKLGRTSQGRKVLAKTEDALANIEEIPQTTYTLYRQFVRNGDRKRYETPYFAKRTQLAAAALRLFMGDASHKDASSRDTVQDYLWDICEESNWVLPAHETRAIDLFSAEIGFVLAETVALLGNTLDAEVRGRVRREIEARILEPYLYHCRLENWYNGGNNWNGVCNSSIGATFLLLRPESMAYGIRLALDSLRVFLDTAFEEDGSSTEGVAYWHYGLINFVAFSEMLRARSEGRIDLLDSEQMRKIAAYPAKMHLSGPWFASFSDCDEKVQFNPGFLARLAERTGEKSLLSLLAPPAEPGGDWRLTMMLRNLLWWDGSQPQASAVTDAHLPRGGTVRLVVERGEAAPVIFAMKAGHNGENHNQNDVGSFIVHVDGENLLTDPGRGLYSRFYFGPHRYENIFANSYGHSVPRFLNGGGQLQATGKEYYGELSGVENAAGARMKEATVEMARAYPLPELVSVQRHLSMVAEGKDAGTIMLRDAFRFEGEPHEVEEAFVTWMDVEIDGASAMIRGQRHALRLSIEEPAGARFEVEQLEEACRENAKEGVLKRLTFRLPKAQTLLVEVSMEVRPVDS